MNEAPTPDRRPYTHTEHGVERPDPYYWMGDKTDPALVPHLERENAWTESQLAHLSDLRSTLYDEMLGYIQEDDETVPAVKGAWAYYSRTVEGKAYRIHCRKPADADGEVILLDENERATDKKFYSNAGLRLSIDGRYIAWSEDTNGSEKYDVFGVDTQTGESLPVAVRGIAHSLTWAADGRTLVYTVADDAMRPYRVYAIDALTEGAEPVLLHEETDERYHLGVGRTSDDRWIIIMARSKLTTHVLGVRAESPLDDLEEIWPREEGVLAFPDHQGDRWVIRHNRDAVNFTLVTRADGATHGDTNTLRAHDAAVYITDVDLFAQHVVISERANGLQQIRVLRNDGESHLVTFPEPAYSVYGSANLTFDTTTFRFGYNSMVTPTQVIDYDLETRTRVIRKQQPVPGYDMDSLETLRLWATAEDGTEVPLSVVRRRDLGEGPHPTLLIGYGSYGMNYPASFVSSRLPLLDRGVIIAIAHIRGGAEMGRAWYENGKFLSKRNTFTDFIACADHLVHTGITARDRLAIRGGSAGGLLMGATMNLRPDLCRAVVAQVAFVDVVTTMLNEKLPLTVIEWEEWGNPNDRTYFDYMMSYSPYDNVAEAAYPDVLATAGLNDPRVGYWEPAKWVARLRDRRTDDGATLLHVHMGAGHGGESGRYGYLRDAALDSAFVLDRIGAAS